MQLQSNQKSKQRSPSPFPFSQLRQVEKRKGLPYQARALRTILIDGLPDSFDPEDIVGCFHPHMINEIQSRQTTLNAPVQSIQIEFRDPESAKKALTSPPFHSDLSDDTHNRIIINRLHPYFGQLWNSTDHGDMKQTPLLLWFWRNKSMGQENDLNQYALDLGYIV